MARTLEDLGEEISKDSVVSNVLGSLPSKYDTLITVWDSVEAGKQNIETLRERLLKEEKKLTKQGEEAMALSISIPRKTDSNNKKRYNDRKSKRSQGDNRQYKQKHSNGDNNRQNGHISHFCRKQLRSQKGKQTGEDPF